MSKNQMSPSRSRGFRVCAAVALSIGAGSLASEVQAQGAPPAAAGVSASGAAGQPSTGAAVADSAQESALNEIVVTAQFRSEGLQTTPIAITAENAAMMEARSQTSLLDVASTAPNVNIRPSTSALGGNTASIYIRGVGQYDSSFALEPGVGIYIDDVYFPTIVGSVFDLLDLDRVEILRGPQGTLAGKNSIGGAIKLYSQKPDGDGGGYIEAGYGDFNQINFRGGDDFTLIPDQLFVRIAGVYKRRDGYETRLDYGCAHPGSTVTPNPMQENCVLGTEGGDDFGGVRAAVRWTPPNSKLEVNFTVDDSVDNGEPVPTKLVYALPSTGLQQYITPAKYVNYSTYTDPTTGFSVPPINRMASDGESLNIRYAFTDDLALTSITAFRHYDGQSGIDGDGTPLGVQDIYSPVSFREFTEEDRLGGKVGLLDYTVGAFYYHGNGYSGGRVDASGVDFLTGDTAISQSISGFLHTVFHVTDQFSVSAGFRYTHETKEYTFSSLSPFDPGQPAALVGAINGDRGDYSGSKPDYRLNAEYEWTSQFMTYATFSTGFKGGGVNPRPFVPSQVVPFGPESIDAYEVGAKSELFDRSLRLNVAAFYNDYKDIQLTITNGYGGFPISAVPLNAGTAHVKGLELEAEAHPVGGLEMDVSASYLDFKYVSLTPAAVVSGIGYGMSTPFTPNTELNAGIQYEIETHVLGGSLTPRLDANYQAHFYTNAANGPYNYTQSRTLVNGRFTWRADAGGWEAALSGTNLLNKYYYLNTFDITSESGIATATPAPPRMWMVSVKHKF
jgi:iron complex outermembrane recepter protein